jgi:ABC-type nitrate/sulfonate/bicarbonate transport system substrate-binding protein
MKIRNLFWAAWVFGAMLPPAARADTTTLRLGFIGASLHLFQSLPFFVAQKNGLFDRQDIKLDVVLLPGVDHMITELDNGTVDISSTALPYLINGVLKGSDAVGVVGGPANMINSLVAQPEITQFADLKGKTIGLSLPVDVISIGARELLARHGVQASDFTAVSLIGTPARAKCLESGRCAAVPLSQPEDILFVRRGYHVLGDSREVIPTMQFNVFAARRSWAAQHKDEVVRFARAMGEADRYVADPAHREEVIAMGVASTGGPADVVAEIYKLYFEPNSGALPRHGEISMPGITAAIQLLGDTGQLQKPLPPAEKFVDLQYLEAAGLQ